jgi:hypothetical protein
VDGSTPDVAARFFKIGDRGRGLALRFAQTDTRSPAVFIDEFDTARFQSSTDNVERGPSRCVNTCLKLADCHNAYPGTLCQFQLAPINQAARRSALRWSKHWSYL